CEMQRLAIDGRSRITRSPHGGAGDGTRRQQLLFATNIEMERLCFQSAPPSTFYMDFLLIFCVCRTIASPISAVEAFPPRSGVNVFPSTNTSSIASRINLAISP